MKKWNLIVDVAKCTNCNCCTLANQDEHVGNEFIGWLHFQPIYDQLVETQPDMFD